MFKKKIRKRRKQLNAPEPGNTQKEVYKKWNLKRSYVLKVTVYSDSVFTKESTG